MSDESKSEITVGNVEPQSNQDSDTTKDICERTIATASGGPAAQISLDIFGAAQLSPGTNGSGGLGAGLPDLAELRLGQDFDIQVGVRKALLTVPVRKPSRQEFVRVNPDPDFRLETAIYEMKDDRETYLVDRSLWPDFFDELKPVCLFTTVNRQDVVFLWPVVMPGSDGRSNPWHQSALQAAQLAMRGWIRVVPKMGLGAYEVFQATAALPDPTWPDSTFQDLIRIAFQNHFVNSADHPVIRQLRGES